MADKNIFNTADFMEGLYQEHEECEETERKNGGLAQAGLLDKLVSEGRITPEERLKRKENREAWKKVNELYDDARLRGHGFDSMQQEQCTAEFNHEITKKFINLEQTAKLKKLDSILCIPDIAALRHSHDKDLIEQYAHIIAEACMRGDLKYEGAVHDWVRLAETSEQVLTNQPVIYYDEIVFPVYEGISGKFIQKPSVEGITPKERLRVFNAANWNKEAFNWYKERYATSRVGCFIKAHEFKRWLITRRDYPIIDDCLLPNWFESVLIAEDYLRANWPESLPQVEAVPDAGAGNGDTVPASPKDIQATKPRKKLKPLKRERNEGLLLLYEIFKDYQVEYLDELPAIKAWGKIINKEFTCDLISIVAETKKHILLSGGEKLDKTDFLEKYRKRF